MSRQEEGLCREGDRERERHNTSVCVCVCVCDRETQKTGYELNTQYNVMPCSSYISVEVIHECNYSKGLCKCIFIQSHCDINTERCP